MHSAALQLADVGTRMVQSTERFGDRLLRIFLPSVDAGACYYCMGDVCACSWGCAGDPSKIKQYIFNCTGTCFYQECVLVCQVTC
jgi:hypothetical protein